MTSVLSWQTLLAFDLLHFVLQGQICLLIQVSLDYRLLHSSPLWWKGHLFWVLFLEGLVGLYRMVKFQLLQYYWLGHRLGFLWYWMVCLGIEQTSFCHFWDCTQVMYFGGTGETVSDFFWGGSKITADGDCSHVIKRCLLLGRKVMTNLDSILKAETLLCQQRSTSSRLWFFQWACIDVRVGLWRKLSAEKLMLLNCVGEYSWESLGLQGDPISPS